MAGHVPSALATRVDMCMQQLQMLSDAEFGATCTWNSAGNAMEILKSESCASIKSGTCTVSVLFTELLKLSRMIFDLQSAFTSPTAAETSSYLAAVHKVATYSQLGLFPTIIFETLALNDNIGQLQSDPLPMDHLFRLLSSLDAPVVSLHSLRQIQINFPGVNNMMGNEGRAFAAALRNSCLGVQCAFKLSMLVPTLPEPCQQSVNFLRSTTLSEDFLSEGASLCTAILHDSMVQGRLPEGYFEVYSAYLDVVQNCTTAAFVSTVSETFWARKLSWKTVSSLFLDILLHLAIAQQQPPNSDVAGAEKEAVLDQMFSIIAAFSTIDIESAAWYRCVDFSEFWASQGTFNLVLDISSKLRLKSAAADISGSGKIAALQVATSLPALCCACIASLVTSQGALFDAEPVKACLSALTDGRLMLSSDAASATGRSNRVTSLLSSCFKKLAVAMELIYSTQEQQQPPENEEANRMELITLLRAARVSEVELVGIVPSV